MTGARGAAPQARPAAGSRAPRRRPPEAGGRGSPAGDPPHSRTCPLCPLPVLSEPHAGELRPPRGACLGAEAPGAEGSGRTWGTGGAVRMVLSPQRGGESEVWGNGAARGRLGGGRGRTQVCLAPGCTEPWLWPPAGQGGGQGSGQGGGQGGPWPAPATPPGELSSGSRPAPGRGQTPGGPVSCWLPRLRGPVSRYGGAVGTWLLDVAGGSGLDHRDPLGAAGGRRQCWPCQKQNQNRKPGRAVLTDRSKLNKSSSPRTPGGTRGLEAIGRGGPSPSPGSGPSKAMAPLHPGLSTSGGGWWGRVLRPCPPDGGHGQISSGRGR